MTRYFDDVTVGDTFESQGSEDITREDILSFARAWNPQAYHIDEEAAKGSFAGGLSASGLTSRHGAVLLRRRGRRCSSVRAPARHHLADRGHQRGGDHVLVDEHIDGAVGHAHAVRVLDVRAHQDDLRLW